MTVVVNGRERAVASGSCISDLIAALELKAERLAVELNQKIIRRADWDSTSLSEGDRVEVVHFVGGGAAYR